MSDPGVPVGEGPSPHQMPAGTPSHGSQGHGEGSWGGMDDGHALLAEPAPAPRS
jgi:hypothetical protein